MMAEKKERRFRHENKYLLSPWQAAVLQVKVGGVLMPDPHARKNGGTYHVRSLYFDDLHDTCLKDNMSGADPRSKFRIRYYNRNLDYIVLEKKTKNRGMGVKTACALTLEECARLITGRFLDPQPDMPKEKQALLTELRVRALIPRIVVDYWRTPFVYPAGNVRVTFDRDLAASDELTRFLAGDYALLPVMPDGQSLMEVKWDELLPLHIKELVQPETLTWTAFSKYTMCRSQSL